MLLQFTVFVTDNDVPGTGFDPGEPPVFEALTVKLFLKTVCFPASFDAIIL